MVLDAGRLEAALRTESAELVEIFSAIQGEGPCVGARHLFVRFSHCDMHCRYCDTPNCHISVPEFRLEVTPGARDFVRRPNPVAFSELRTLILERILAPTRHAAVSYTGGEPLLQPEAILATAPFVRARGVKVLLETDATLPEAFERVRAHVDILSMDWKLPTATGEPSHEAAHRRILTASAGISCYVKAVFDRATPLDEVVHAARGVAELRPDAPFILQPVSPVGAGIVPPTPAQVVEYQAACLAVHRDVRVIPQVHRLMGQP